MNKITEFGGLVWLDRIFQHTSGKFFLRKKARRISFGELLTTEDTESTEEKQLRHAGFRYANGAA
jgi:hypothetical protein